MSAPGVRVTDPCYYCGRTLDDVRRLGCGSQQFPQDTVDRLCWVLDHVRKKP
jgi:hypothetical protein